MARIFKDCLFTTERGQASETVSVQSDSIVVAHSENEVLMIGDIEALQGYGN
jgi:hypothetical protein